MSADDLHDEEMAHLSSLYNSVVASRRGSPSAASRGRDPLLERSLHSTAQQVMAREAPARAEEADGETGGTRIPPARPLAMADTCFCCSPALETAVFRLCALDFGPMGALLAASMAASAREVAYFITDTAAYIVSKMWDDMLSSEIFHTSTAFLCSDEYGRPCNRPASVVIQ